LGATCLHAAADSGQVEVAKQLINVEAMDVNMQDDQGYTPLHLAVMGNHAKMATLLLALGAKVDIKDTAHQRTAEDEFHSSSNEELKKVFESFRPKLAAPGGNVQESKKPEIVKNDIKEDTTPTSPKSKGISRLFGGKKSERPNSATSNQSTSSSSLSKTKVEKKRKDNEERRKNESRDEARKREEEDRLIAEDRRREEERRRGEEDKKKDDDKLKEEQRKRHEEKRKKKKKKSDDVKKNAKLLKKSAKKKKEGLLLKRKFKMTLKKKKNEKEKKNKVKKLQQLWQSSRLQMLHPFWLKKKLPKLN